MGKLFQKIHGRDAIPQSWDYDPPAGIEVIGVRTLDDLAKHADAWDELFLKTDACPYSSYSWMNAFLSNLIEDHESWICLFAYQENELIGVLPLVVRRAYRVAGRSLILFRTPFGLLHTGISDCLMPPENHIALDLFFDYLSKIPSAWPIISLKSLFENSPVIVHLAKYKTYSIIIPTLSWNYIELPKSYEEYCASLPSQLKQLIKRKTKKLNQRENVKLIAREDQRSTEENMNLFMEAEHSNWKGENSSSIKSNPKHAAALLMAAKDLEKRGWMEWCFIEADNRTIATHYSIRVHRTIYYVKTGFVDQYQFCSPGSLLFNKMIESAYQNDDVDEINILGDYQWHYQWQIKSRQLYDCLLLPRIPILSSIIKLIFKYMRKKKCVRKVRLDD